MKKRKMVIGVIALFLFALLAVAVIAADKEKEFQKISKMSIQELTEATRVVLGKKYPNEDWEKYKFPKYVYIHPAVTLGYKIAVKEPDLLAKFPCYCFCQEMGHKNLSYCFLEKGEPNKFNDHASACNICVTQALMAFLWNEVGAKKEEMQKAFKELYGK